MVYSSLILSVADNALRVILDCECPHFTGRSKLNSSMEVNIIFLSLQLSLEWFHNYDVTQAYTNQVHEENTQHNKNKQK